ncbi:VOC family protein [Nocardiopsis sp. RSe5-2]|uniref:VOC family protein n=1 Tax=Nocardiopsis endophytica TaxID=3018445 RepID=A0ABT4TYU0_9ACTN|nr:VOC family protein [Nocardiopsis endophytica]MDA2809571.1 VOC family protein [Nocardiopsis endophytica]
MFGALTVTKIHTSDASAATAFYRDRLGLEVIEAHGTHTTVFATGNGGELIVTEQPSERPVDIAFTGVDIPAAHEALSDLGATDVVPHKTGERFELTDPDGNKVIFVNA